MNDGLSVYEVESFLKVCLEKKGVVPLGIKAFVSVRYIIDAVIDKSVVQEGSLRRGQCLGGNFGKRVGPHFEYDAVR